MDYCNATVKAGSKHYICEERLGHYPETEHRMGEFHWKESGW